MNKLIRIGAAVLVTAMAVFTFRAAEASVGRGIESPPPRRQLGHRKKHGHSKGYLSRKNVNATSDEETCYGNPYMGCGKCGGVQGEVFTTDNGKHYFCAYAWTCGVWT